MIKITYYKIKHIARDNLSYLLRHSNCLITTKDFFKITGFSLIYQQESRSNDPNFPQEKCVIIYLPITMVNE